jgi:hypothetical protein
VGAVDSRRVQVLGRLVEEHALGLWPRVVLAMPVGLGGEVRRGPGRGSLGSIGGLSQRRQEPAQALRTGQECFELHRPAALRTLNVDVETALEQLGPRPPTRARALVHALSQAILKRGVPRPLLTGAFREMGSQLLPAPAQLPWIEAYDNPGVCLPETSAPWSNYAAACAIQAAAPEQLLRVGPKTPVRFSWWLTERGSRFLC